MVFCGNCGTKIDDGVLFCPECGTKVLENGAPKAAAADAPQAEVYDVRPETQAQSAYQQPAPVHTAGGAGTGAGSAQSDAKAAAGGFIQSYILMLKNYANFNGRTRRRDYWGAVLVNAVIVIVLQLVGAILGAVIGFLGGLISIVGLLYSLAILVPGISISIRRMHDISKSGFFVLLALIPIVGWIIVLVLACMDSTPGSNQYGPNPKGM